jgi:hypothetical protein
VSNTAQAERKAAKERRRAQSKSRHEARRTARAERDAELSKLHARYVADVQRVWEKWRATK